VIHATNINRLKKQEEKLKLRNLAIELIQEAVVIVKVENLSIAYANQAFFELSGFTKVEILGGKLKLFSPPYNKMLFADQTDLKLIEKFQRALKFNRKFEGRIFSKKKNGDIFYNRFSLIPVLDEEGKVTQYIASMKEIKRRK
jgi:PAS domain S-box-containing protein